MKVVKSNQDLSIRTNSNLAYLAISSFMVGSAAFLFGLIYGLVCPAVQPDSSSAESSTSSGTTTTVSSDSVISITAPDNVTLDITPSFSDATFSTATASISVATNNSYGYSLSMGTSGTDSSGSTTTSLVHKTKSSNTIPSITSATTEANFPTNSWGYTTDNNGTDTTLGQITAGYYQPLTTSSDSTLIKKTSAAASSGDTTTVTFGAKADYTLPSGDYSNTVVFSATANPKPASEYTIFDISTMQEMTSTVCGNTTTPKSSATTYDTDDSHAGDTSYIPQTTLTDTRDNKSYAIRKLADGNCWMVQNLALGVGTALSSDDTDIESTSTYTMPTTSTTNFTEGSNPQYSGDNNNEMHTGTHTDGYIATVSDGSKYSSDLTDTGNWYSWYVATAGTGTNTMSSGEATSSICPKGWKLPTGTSSGQFYALYTAYNSSQANLNAIFPLQLSGYYYSSGLDGSGYYGYWWSSTAYSTPGAYALGAYQSYISPAYVNGKYNGFSVRCVASN